MKLSRVEQLFKKYVERSATEKEKAILLQWISNGKNLNKAKLLMDRLWGYFRKKGKIFTESQSKEILHTILKPGKKRIKIASHSQKNKPAQCWRVVVALLRLIITGGYILQTGQQTKPTGVKLMLK